MDYDIHGSWDKMTGHIAPMYAHPQDNNPWLNVNSSLAHWKSRGAQESKLVMGIPLYGNSFTLAAPHREDGLFAPTTGPGAKGSYSNQGGILAYYEICSKPWPKRMTDPHGRMGPYVVDGDQWVSYDDERMIGKKTDFIREMGLGGAMVWSLDFDDFAGICGQGKYPLLKAVNGGLRRKRKLKMNGLYDANRRRQHKASVL
jgi:chitinase